MLEIHDPRIVVILTGEESAGEIGRMNVGERMVMAIPSPITEVEAANASKVVVDNDDLLVVGPEFDGV